MNKIHKGFYPIKSLNFKGAIAKWDAKKVLYRYLNSLPKIEHRNVGLQTYITEAETALISELLVLVLMVLIKSSTGPLLVR